MLIEYWARFVIRNETISTVELVETQDTAVKVRCTRKATKSSCQNEYELSFLHRDFTPAV